VVGLIQGVSELFPVSSLGHNVLIPALVGGSWGSDLNVAKPESPYLAFIVGLHVATAIALLIYFWRDWVRIIGGFLSSIRDRRIETVDQKLAWMILLATIPVGLVGVGFEHTFRVLFGKPIRAAIFLMINGLILYAGERYRTRRSLAADAEAEAAERSGRRAALRPRAEGVAGVAVSPATGGGAATLRGPGPAAAPRPGGMHASGQRAVRQQEAVRAVQADQRIVSVGYVEGVIIGSAQILALLAGISRDGVAMVTGMFRGLSRQDAARFSFLLSTPVIFAAGFLKVGDLFGPLGNGIRGQVLVASILSGVGAYVSVRFLIRYFQTRTLTPFAIYCVVFGLVSAIYLSVK
jgi:undecaprenyl-diphosphatase